MIPNPYEGISKVKIQEQLIGGKKKHVILAKTIYGQVGALFEFDDKMLAMQKYAEISKEIEYLNKEPRT